MYSWEHIAVRTETVYDAAAASERDDSMLARLNRLYRCDTFGSSGLQISNHSCASPCLDHSIAIHMK